MRDLGDNKIYRDGLTLGVYLRLLPMRALASLMMVILVAAHCNLVCLVWDCQEHQEDSHTVTNATPPCHQSASDSQPPDQSKHSDSCTQHHNAEQSVLVSAKLISKAFQVSIETTVDVAALPVATPNSSLVRVPHQRTKDYSPVLPTPVLRI